MKKVFEWMKAHGGVLVGFAAPFILALSWLKIFSLYYLSPEAKVQAALMVLLISITGFYAYQTHRLVIEERRALKDERDKRIAEYGEKRITQFLEPLAEKLEIFKGSLAVITNPRNSGLIEHGNGLPGPLKYVTLASIKTFFIEHDFMADLLLQEEMFKFFKETEASWPTFNSQDDTYALRFKNWQDEIKKAIDGLRAQIGIRIATISRQIQKTYGYYVNKPISWDSFYPPTKPPE